MVLSGGEMTPENRRSLLEPICFPKFNRVAVAKEVGMGIPAKETTATQQTLYRKACLECQYCSEMIMDMVSSD
jgi:hypothetical protein